VVEPHDGHHPSNSAPLAIWHFDFYRFNDPQEFEEAGFRDVFASTGLKIAEWPKQADGMLPTPDLQLTLQVDDQEARHVQVQASTTIGLSILEGLLAVLPPTVSAHANSTS
jgi:tRNA threonylcarbamoyladenosine biosynthesis protein TsaE